MSPASPGATATNASPTPAAPDQATPRLPLALRVFGLIPLALCSLLGRLVGMLAYAASGDYRRKVNDNLRIAGYGPGRVRRRAIIEAGRMVVECPYVWSHKPRAISRLVLATDLEPIERAEARGKGVLILMPHLGSFEAAARFYAARRPITVLFKPPKIEFVRRWLIAARAAEGIQAVPPTVGGLRTMLRTLRRGDIVGLLPDQVPTAGDGVWAPFFGQPAYTMTLPERLVEMTDCTVVLAVCERQAGGRGWRMRFEAFDEMPTPEAVNREFERLIRARPEQYLWGYNRYKRPPGVADFRNAELLDPAANSAQARRRARAASSTGQ